MEDKKLFYKKLLTIVLPIAFQYFMLAAVSATDAIMLGMLNQDSLSAVSLAGQIQFVLNLFLAALTIGTTILAAQYWGKNDLQAVEKILGIALKYSIVISMIFFVANTFFPEVLMRIFTSETELINKGVQYLRIVGVSYLLTGVSQMYLAIMKNSGDAIRSAIISSSSMVLNIVLNAIFIFGFLSIPAMGIAGAAIATVLSRIFEIIWIFLEANKKNCVKMHIHHIIHSDTLLKNDFLKYTLPVLGNQLVWGGGLTMYSAIIGHLGSDAIAANAMVNIVKNLLTCLCIGISSGGGIIVGNELGKGELQKAKEYGNTLSKISIFYGFICAAILVFISPVIVRYSNISDAAQRYLTVMLWMSCYYLIGKSINCTVIGGIFCAGGDSKFGLLCDTIVMWAITVPLGCIAAFYLKLPVLVVYFIISIDEVIKLPAVFSHYKKYLWVKDLTRE